MSVDANKAITWTYQQSILCIYVCSYKALFDAVFFSFSAYVSSLIILLSYTHHPGKAPRFPINPNRLYSLLPHKTKAFSRNTLCFSNPSSSQVLIKMCNAFVFHPDFLKLFPSYCAGIKMVNWLHGNHWKTHGENYRRFGDDKLSHPGVMANIAAASYPCK